MLEDKELRQQVKTVTDAAKATPVTLGLFAAWREQTRNTHATEHLAVAYAPKTDDDRSAGTYRQRNMATSTRTTY